MSKKNKKKDNKTLIYLGIGGLVLYLMLRPKTSSADPGETDPGETDPGGTGLPLPNLPRGLSNNNPHNIKLTNINWVGKVPNNINTDGTFEQFFDLSDGFRASVVNINAYKNLGYNTLRKIIQHWAPYDGGNYLNFVSNQSGFAPDEVLIPKFYNTASSMWKVLQPMAVFENGGSYQTQVDQSWSAFEKGFNKANE